MREVKREGGETWREGTGRGVGETGAWRLEGRSDYTGMGEVQEVCVCVIDSKHFLHMKN